MTRFRSMAVKELNAIYVYFGQMEADVVLGDNTWWYVGQQEATNEVLTPHSRWERIITDIFRARKACALGWSTRVNA